MLGYTIAQVNIAMTISCFPATETQIRHIAGRLKQIGMFDRYGEQVHGESVMITVETKDFAEREAVKAVLHQAGITEFFYSDTTAA